MKDATYAYKMGYDCGMNGASLTNSNYAIFSCPENTSEWERGKREGEAMLTATKLKLNQKR